MIAAWYLLLLLLYICDSLNEVRTFIAEIFKHWRCRLLLDMVGSRCKIVRLEEKVTTTTYCYF